MIHVQINSVLCLTFLKFPILKQFAILPVIRELHRFHQSKIATGVESSSGENKVKVTFALCRACYVQKLDLLRAHGYIQMVNNCNAVVECNKPEIHLSCLFELNLLLIFASGEPSSFQKCCLLFNEEIISNSLAPENCQTSHSKND